MIWAVEAVLPEIRDPRIIGPAPPQVARGTSWQSSVIDMTKTWILTSCLLIASLAGCQRSATTTSDATADEPAAASIDVGSALRTDASPVVVLHTSLGPIKLRLNTDKAPLTVDNFLSQVDNGAYHQTIFHDVTPGFTVLAGSVRPDLTEKRGRYTLRNEANNGLSNRRGTIAMAQFGRCDGQRHHAVLHQRGR